MDDSVRVTRRAQLVRSIGAVDTRLWILSSWWPDLRKELCGQLAGPAVAARSKARGAEEEDVVEVAVDGGVAGSWGRLRAESAACVLKLMSRSGHCTRPAVLRVRGETRELTPWQVAVAAETVHATAEAVSGTLCTSPTGVRAAQRRLLSRLGVHQASLRAGMWMQVWECLQAAA